ncbi:hypothetical protein [uncultured Paracoccus sp.]|uniref:hypothetical protein n=1 Tax=uncultured Paracoccus sp. TaxID=189685 RepID=UPI0025E03FC7|nr:hypothetical protein [uncultured Paracoccus sp.]
MKQRLIATALVILPTVAAASSEEAWDEFRASVETACLALVETPDSATVTIEVNPFGSESYGAALVTATYDSGADRMICIFDKQAETAEITAPFTDAAPAD